MTRRRRWTTWLTLLVAGWRPCRNIWCQLDLPSGLEVFPEAKRILTEYGGLKFQRSSEVVHLDPSTAEPIVGQIRRYEEASGRRLYPLGFYEHQDQLYLLIDDQGVVYTLTLLDDAPEPLASSALEPLASSFERALESLLGGSRLQREAHEDLRSIGLQGKVWELGFPALEKSILRKSVEETQEARSSLPEIPIITG